MTGAEVAGLALAVLPLVVNQLDNYVRGLESIKGLRRYRRELEGYSSTLSAQYAIFLNTLEIFLQDVVDDHDDRSELISKPGGPGWKDAQFQRRMSERLGRDYNVFTGTLTGLCGLLEGLSNKLDRYTPDYSKAAAIKSLCKIKFRNILSKAIYEDMLNRIDKANQILKTLSDQSHQLAQTRSGPARLEGSLRGHQETRRNARALQDRVVQDQGLKSPCRNDHTVCCRRDTTIQGSRGIQSNLRPARTHEEVGGVGQDAQSLKELFHHEPVTPYNIRESYRASAGANSPSVMDTLTTNFAEMGTRFLTQESRGLKSDIFESHNHYSASPHRHHQHNLYPVPGYSPPDLTPMHNPKAHQSASGHLIYPPISRVGSGHAGTYSTSEQSSLLFKALQNQKAYGIRGESYEVYSLPLDFRYQVQISPGEFFVVGRVFAMLWHDGRGQQETVISDFISKSNFTRGRFGEKIFSGIRHMVVVKAMSESAWCLPITTYGGQGVAKPGVDPAKHAIVYMRGSTPTCRANEPEMIKEPLEVEPASPNEKLDKIHRLNFGKVYTVEHNVKVRPIGMISCGSMAKFRGYASNEFRLDI
ncbi:hypothetical protein IFM61392_08293 [Aspergillus lentulus]|nr:hypothetical protein IFM61392_08293 [Aspergillus lentulus]